MNEKSKVALAFACATLLSHLAAPLALAQNYPITAQQKNTANQVAQAGIPLSELAANAPDSYTVKPGDTLWGISRLFLKSPWRWPELWGMNLNDIKNPHLIYPGQQLFLDKRNGRATLRMNNSPDAQAARTVRLSPNVRYSELTKDALATLNNSLIEPFLAEPLIVSATELSAAARVVAPQDGRILLARGDRAYARGTGDSTLVDDPTKPPRAYRVFRDAVAQKDPGTGEILGYEAQYVGRAQLVRSESTQYIAGSDGKPVPEIIPATIDIVAAKREMHIGDRLLPEPPAQLLSYVPHAPNELVSARVVSVYGEAVENASQGQIILINRGTHDGMEVGHVLTLLKNGQRVVDKTDPTLPLIKLPDERSGLVMVFRTFDRLSYALVLEIVDSAKVGDHLISPR